MNLLALEDYYYCDNCDIIISKEIAKKTETCAGYIYCDDCNIGGYKDIEFYLDD